MPVWSPPTPPSGASDVYVERWARALYRAGPAPDTCLPPVTRRADRRSPRRRPAPRAAPAPPSLFERAGGRPRPRPRAPAPPRAAPPAPDWSGAEDAALRRALRLQRLGPEPGAARLPNWEWAAELVNEAARAYRSARAARDRHDALADPERARRKHKKPAARRRGDEDAPRPPLARLDAMREAGERRRQQPKRRLDDAAHNTPKQAALLLEHGIDYETPPSPVEVATRRADRIAKEKLKAGASAAPPAPAPAPPAPQRVVVAAHPPAPAPRPLPPAAPPQHALYRQQALPARHHLKILHHAQSGEGGAGAALRTLQLQQLSLRRAPAPRAAPPAPHHVVVAHLAPAPPPSAPPPAPPATQPDTH